MKIINESKEKTKMVLEDNDILEIFTLKKNKEYLTIKCINGVLHIEELRIPKIKEKVLEEKEIEKMKEFLKRRNND